MKAMRLALFTMVALALAVEAASQTSVGDADTDRPGAIYTSLRISDPMTCASLCAADNICMAWTYRSAGACDLKAVAPDPIPARGVRSGLSARAPDFARRVTLAMQAAPISGLRDATEYAAPPLRPADDYALLGGPSTEHARLDDAGLR